MPEHSPCTATCWPLTAVQTFAINTNQKLVNGRTLLTTTTEDGYTSYASCPCHGSSRFTHALAPPNAVMHRAPPRRWDCHVNQRSRAPSASQSWRSHPSGRQRLHTKYAVSKRQRSKRPEQEPKGTERSCQLEVRLDQNTSRDHHFRGSSGGGFGCSPC